MVELVDLNYNPIQEVEVPKQRPFGRIPEIEEGLQELAGVEMNQDFAGTRQMIAVQRRKKLEQELYDVTEGNLKTGAVTPEAASEYMKQYVVDSTEDTALEEEAVENSFNQAMDSNSQTAINTLVDGADDDGVIKDIIIKEMDQMLLSTISEGLSNPFKVVGDLTESFVSTQLLENKLAIGKLTGTLMDTKVTTKDFAEAANKLLYTAKRNGSKEDVVNTYNYIANAILSRDNAALQYEYYDYFVNSPDYLADIGGFAEGAGIVATVASKVGDIYKLGKAIRTASKTTQVQEGIAKTLLQPSQSSFKIADAGKLDDVTTDMAAEARANRLFDDLDRAGIYNKEELAELAESERTNIKNKLAPVSSDPIDIANVVEGQDGLVSATITIGDNSGNAMTIEQAQKLAKRLGLPEDSYAITKQSGDGYLLQFEKYLEPKRTMDIRYNDWLTAIEKGTTPGARFLSGISHDLMNTFLGRTVTSKEAYKKSIIAEGKEMAVRHELVKSYQNSYAKLNDIEKDEARNIIHKGLEGVGKWYSDEELVSDFNANDKLIKFYHDYREIANRLDIDRNVQEIRKMHRGGVRKWVNENDTLIGTKQSVKANAHNSRIIVKDFDTGEIVKDLSKFDDDSHFLVKLHRASNHSDENFTHMLVRNDTWSEQAINGRVLGYRGGGPRHYENGQFFIKCGTSILNSATGNRVNGFVKTVTTADNIKDAQKAAREINQAMELYRRFQDNAAALQRALDSANFELFKIDRAEDLLQMIRTADNPKGVLDPAHDVQVLKAGERYKYKDGVFEDIVDADEGLQDLLQNEQNLYRGRGNILDSVNGPTMRLASIDEVYNNMVDKISHLEAYGELMQWYDKEFNKYKFFIGNMKDIENLPVAEKFMRAEILDRANLEGDALLKARAFENLRSNAIKVLNAQTAFQKKSRLIMESTARLIGAIPFNFAMKDSMVKAIAKANPTGFAKGIVYFNAMCANTAQALTQSLGILQSLSMGKWSKLSPIRASYGGLMSRFYFAAKNYGMDGVADALKTAIKKTSVMSDEQWSAFEAIMKKGGGELVSGLQPGYSKSMSKSYADTNTIGRRFLNLMYAPVSETNGMNFIVSAMMAAIEAKPGTKFSDIYDEAHKLFLNMTRAGNSKFQAGKTFIPFTDTFAQWTSYPVRFLEALTGGTGLTKWQRAKLLAGQIGLWGVGGTFLTREQETKARIKMGEDSNKWMLGLMGNYLKEKGIEWDQAPRLASLIDWAFKVMQNPEDIGEILGGAPALKSINQVWDTASSILSLFNPERSMGSKMEWIAQSKNTMTGLKNVARFWTANEQGLYYNTRGSVVAKDLTPTQAWLLMLGPKPGEVGEDIDAWVIIQDAKKYIKTAMDDLRPMIQDLKYNRNVPGDEDRARGALTKLSDTVEWYKAMIKSEWGSSPLYNSFVKEVNKAVWETDNANENCIQALIKTLGMDYLQYVRRGTDE